MSLQKESKIEIDVAHHPGRLRGLLTTEALDENDMCNSDETYFIINVDNGKTLEFCGFMRSRYADVGSEREGFTVVVRLSGLRGAIIEAPLMMFMKQ